MADRTTLEHRITEAMEAKGLSMDDLARQLGITVKTLKNWLSGRTMPRPNKLQMLAGVLGVSLTWLLSGTEEHDPLSGRPSRLDQLEQKVERMAHLQRELFQLSNEVAQELTVMQQIDEELENLVA